MRPSRLRLELRRTPHIFVTSRPLLMPFLFVAAGGALGAVARYGVYLLTTRADAAALPVGTWIVNLGGSFLIGLVVPLFLAKSGLSDGLRLAVVVGFLGSFTTFSTFSLDTLALLEVGRPGWALANALGSVVLGLGFVALGIWIGRHFI